MFVVVTCLSPVNPDHQSFTVADCVPHSCRSTFLRRTAEPATRAAANTDQQPNELPAIVAACLGQWKTRHHTQVIKTILSMGDSFGKPIAQKKGYQLKCWG